MDKFCANCGKPANASRFCPSCGYDTLAKKCVKCDYAMAIDEVFCWKCGFDNTENIQNAKLNEVQSNVTPIIPSQQQSNQDNATPLDRQFENIPTEIIVSYKKVNSFIPIILIVFILIGGAIGALFITGILGGDESSVSSHRAGKNNDDNKDNNDEIDVDEDDIAIVTTKVTTEMTTEVTTEPTDSPQVGNDIDVYGVFNDSGFNHGYQQAIATMIHGVQTNDYDLFISPYPQCIIDTYNKDFPTYEEKQAYVEKIYNAYYEAAGGDYVLNCETITETKMTSAEVIQLQSLINTTYNGNVIVSEAYTVDFTINYTSAFGSNGATTKIICALINGEWFLIE